MLPAPTLPVDASDVEILVKQMKLFQGTDGIYRLVNRPSKDNLIDDTLPGFRGGFVSSWALLQRVAELGVRLPKNKTKAYLETKGYYQAGRAKCPLPEEGDSRPILYMMVGAEVPADITDAYKVAQGYETGPVVPVVRRNITPRKRMTPAEIAAALDFTVPGFRNGFISSRAFGMRFPKQIYGPNVKRIEAVMKAAGYFHIGRVDRGVPQEGGARPDIYVNFEFSGNLWAAYREAQGW